MDFSEWIDLASERLGGEVLYANDDFFATKDNLLKPSKPVFIEGKYTDVGKWMDGWETRRRRTPGYDWCILRLGMPGILCGIVVDTSHFKGNYPEQCSLEACSLDGQPDVERLTSAAMKWVEILPKSDLQGDSENRFVIDHRGRATHLRFKIFPDGGVARLRVYGEAAPDWNRLVKQGGDIDLAAVEHGGRVLSCSDMFFGTRQNLIMPGRGADMSDGWETRRRRGPGHDWVILRLGTRGAIHRVEVDTAHFKGNFPESFSLETCCIAQAETENPLAASVQWKGVIARTKLQADMRHFYELEGAPAGEATHVRFNIYPDGGVSRLRIFGSISR
jgi:allantoicase